MDEGKRQVIYANLALHKSGVTQSETGKRQVIYARSGLVDDGNHQTSVDPGSVNVRLFTQA